MALLDHPDAQALLNDATLTPETVRGCRDRLRWFLGFFAYPPEKVYSRHYSVVADGAEGVSLR